MIHARLLGTALGLLVFVTPAKAQDSPLAQIPGQAPLVLHVRGVERTKDRLLTLIKNSLPAETARDLEKGMAAYYFAGRQLKGLAPEGPIFLVFFELPIAEGLSLQSKAALFLRVTNYADFRDGVLKEAERQKLEKDKAGLDVAVIETKPVYFQKIGQYAVVTAHRNLALQVQKRRPGLDQVLDKETTRKFLAADVSVYLHTPSLVKEFADFFKEGRKQIENAFMKFNAFHKGDKNAEQMVKGTMDLLFQAVEDSRHLVAFADFRPNGLALQGRLDIGRDTRTGKFMTGFKPASFAEMGQLPAGHMAYSAFQVEPALLKVFPSALYGISSDPESPGYKTIQEAIRRLADANPRLRLGAFRQLALSPVPRDDLTVWQYDDPAKAAAARLQLLKALQAGDVLEGAILKDRPTLSLKARNHRGFTLHHVRLTWDIEQMITRQVGQDAPPEVKQKMIATMQKLLGNGREFWFGANDKVWLQLGAKDWPTAQKQLDHYLNKKSTIAAQPAYQETRNHLPAQATVLYVIEMSAYGRMMAQMMADFMQGLTKTPATIPAADRRKPTYFGVAITLLPRCGQLDVWLPADAIRAYYTSLQGLFTQIKTATGPQEDKDQPKKDPGKEEFAKLDGTWRLVKMEIEGKSLLEKREVKLIIKDGKVTSDAKEAPEDGLELSKILDPSRKPKQITVPNFLGGDSKKGVTAIGIYELHGDELRVCAAGVETANLKRREKERPTAFDSKQGLLVVFKRVKK